MTHIPKRALVLYCPSIPNQPIPNVDRITLNGCSGQIALEKNQGNIFTNQARKKKKLVCCTKI
jgi:hypothetical protein